jgi:hypothetical protein
MKYLFSLFNPKTNKERKEKMIEKLGHEQHAIGTEKAFKLVDKNGDGHLSAADVPFPPGSLEAKKAWAQIDAQPHSPEMVAKAKKLGFEKATGMYMGKPLVPGPEGNDVDFWKDRLIVKNGLDPQVAQKLVDKAIAQFKSGGSPR